LAPGVSITCTATYVVTQVDVDAGEIVNTATASGDDPNGNTTESEPDTETTIVDTAAAIDIDKIGPNGTLSAGEIIEYTFVVTNTGDVTLTDVEVDDPLANPVSCPAGVLPPGASIVCSASYEVTQTDIDNGEIVNVADAIGTDPDGESATDSDIETTGAVQLGGISIAKNAPTGNLAVGEIITYTFEVTNEGNVTLTNVSVDDPLANPVTCNTTILAPNDSTLCSADYVVTQADVDAGLIINTATVTGTDPNGGEQGGEDSQVQPIPSVPVLDLDKFGDGPASPGSPITYTFEVTNLGNVTITGITVDDPLVGIVTCPSSSLSPGDSMACTATYAPTQADVDAGNVINTAAVSGQAPDGTGVSDVDSETTDIEGASSIDVQKFGPAAPLVAGEVVTYTFVVTNTGEVTLNNVSVIDPTAGPVFCSTNILAPGEATTCSSSYYVTQADVDAGEVTNVATASGRGPDGTIAEDDGQATTPAPQSPGISVTKQSNVLDLVLDEIITYTFTATNTGNVTLTNLAIIDALVPAVTCNSTTLAPLESTTCTGEYVVTQADVDAGTLENSATGTADSPSGPISDSATDIVDGFQDPVIDIDKMAPDGPFDLGETITYDLIVTNTGNVTLSGIIIDDPLTGGAVCPADSLFPGQSMICVASYVVTQADVDAGPIVNQATVLADAPDGSVSDDTDTEVSDVLQVPGVEVVKNQPVGVLAVGEAITYTFDVTNTGNVTIVGLQVLDPITGPIACADEVLAPGSSTICSADYTVTQADVDAGGIDNTASAIGETPGGPAVDDDAITTPIAAEPSLDLTKNEPIGTFAVGTPAAYSLTIVNTGNVTLTNVVANDPLADPLNCGTNVLQPNESTTCTAIVIVTQAMVDNGEVTNNASVVGEAPDGSATGDEDSVTVDVPQSPAVNIDKDAPTGVLEVGEAITYTFIATNIGNVSVTSFVINDPVIETVTCQASSLAPGQSTECTGTYTITQADVDLGRVVNTATMVAVTPGGPATDEDTETTEWATESGLALTKSEPVGDLNVGEILTYMFTATNVGDVVLSNLAIDDPLTSAVICDTTTLAPGDTATCTSTYVVSQDDVDAGMINNVATAVAIDPSGQSVGDIAERNTTISADQGIELVKLASSATASVGDVITYALTVTNTGLVTLVDIAVSDPTAKGVVCPATALEPGESMVCTADLTVTQDDVDEGSVTNNASVQASDPAGRTVSDTDTSVVDTASDASIEMNKVGPTRSVRRGQSVTYRFELTNTGGTTIENIVVEDPLVGIVTCPRTTLAPGATTTCFASYVVTAEDERLGRVVNQAQVNGDAKGTGGTAQAVSANDEVTTRVEPDRLTELARRPEPPALIPFSPATPPSSSSSSPPRSSRPSRADIPDRLAFTGRTTHLFAAAGMLLVATGTAMLTVRRRRLQDAPAVADES